MRAAVLANLMSMGWACGQVPAQPDSPSAGCADALSRLDTLRRERAAPAAIEIARRAASRACLGAATPALPASRPAPALPQSPVPVPPPASPAARLPPPAVGWPPSAPFAAPPPSVEVGRPTFLDGCDAGGCRDPQGRYVPRAGSALPGPHGPCLETPGGAVCP